MVDGGPSVSGNQDDRSEKIDTMVASLIEIFGDRAIEVSERQVDAGSAPSVSDIWREIVIRIRKRQLRA